jgi:hypothetical protein
MVIPPPTWQEMIGSLPPGEQAEIAALLAGSGEPPAAEEDDRTT